MIYGVDISTSIVGLATFNNDGIFVRSDHCDLRKIDGPLMKAHEFRQFLDGLQTGRGFYCPDEENFVFVEERLGNFAAGRTMLQTLMKLAAFNSVCSYILWSFQPGPQREIIYLHPSTWKSAMKKEGLLIPKGSDKKKEITLDFVMKKEPDFAEIVRMIGLNRNENPQPWCYDEADAWCLGKAGFKKLCTERGSSPLSATRSKTVDGPRETRPSSSAETRKDAQEVITSGSSP
jgi:hypothetical protein